MWAIFVIVFSPSADHRTRFLAAAEPLDAQAFVAELAVEAFARAVLPRLARLDQSGPNALIRDPLEQCKRYELRPVVRTQDLRQAVIALDLLEDANEPV